jgi:predicted aldo/keto reductase-like oxidoreductase
LVIGFRQCGNSTAFEQATLMQRRKFIGGLALTSTFSASRLVSMPVLANNAQSSTGAMPYRALGKTGENVSCVGLGGFHLGQSHLEEPDAIKLFQVAVDRGINFSDNSWDYNQGASEKRVGKALKGRRDKVFVMTKFDGRTKGSALSQLDESLQRLEVDHVDLWQFHENIRLEDPDRFFADGGAAEAMLEARQKGKVRYFGFTGHKDPSVHLRMLELAAKHDFNFDTVQMPLNVMDAHFRSFEKLVLPVLVQRGIGVLGMKSMASGHILQGKTVGPIDCLHYALTLPTSVVITGIDSMAILDQAFQAASSLSSVSKDEIASILKKTQPAAADGRFEPFKTSAMFDSTAAHPEWLGYSPPA